MMSRIAFYATIKPPDHPIASGDRLIARNLIAALELGGNRVELASRFIAYSKREADNILTRRKADALAEADQVIGRLKDNKPDLWITYHPYCKAPDWIGPRVTKALDIPYVTVEAARTGQGFENGGDRWANWRKEAQEGIRLADLHIALKPTDVSWLKGLLGPDAPVTLIAPFIDTALPDIFSDASLPQEWRDDVPIILTVGMMRPGKKLKNYEILAKALTPLQHLHWTIAIIGGGPEEPTIREYFAAFDQHRIHFCGEVSHPEVLAHMAKADVFVWPGWKEPIGMVYLEAQLMGLPVAALDSMGVSISVRNGETGLLAPEGDVKRFSENIALLLSQPSLRHGFGKAAKNSVVKNHSLEAASQALNKALETII